MEELFDEMSGRAVQVEVINQRKEHPTIIRFGTPSGKTHPSGPSSNVRAKAPSELALESSSTAASPPAVGPTHIGNPRIQLRV